MRQKLNQIENSLYSNSKYNLCENLIWYFKSKAEIFVIRIKKNPYSLKIKNFISKL